jgi:hypothetical protein
VGQRDREGSQTGRGLQHAGPNVRQGRSTLLEERLLEAENQLRRARWQGRGKDLLVLRSEMLPEMGLDAAVESRLYDGIESTPRRECHQPGLEYGTNLCWFQLLPSA